MNYLYTYAYPNSPKKQSNLIGCGVLVKIDFLFRTYCVLSEHLCMYF